MPNDLPQISIKPAATTQGTVSKPNGNNSSQNSPIKVSEKPVVRNIAPLNQYNRETGIREARTDSPWGNQQADTEPEVMQDAPPVRTDVKTSSTQRQEQWKSEQQAKKEARQEQQVSKQVKQQALAKDLFFKGDLAGAAQALGMSPTDLITYVDNARLQIPNKKEELSPEQIRAKEDTDYRADRAKFEQDQRDFKFQVIATNYIREHMDPILTDKKAFEFIHKNDVNKIKNYAYNYMNNHLQETGETLDVKDVLEHIENQFVETFRASIEKLRDVDKMKEYFVPRKDKVEQEQVQDEEPSKFNLKVSKVPKVRDVNMRAPNFEEPTLESRNEVPLNSRFPLHDDSEDVERMMAEAEEEEQKVLSQTHNAVRRPVNNTGKKIPFALLSREERLAQMKLDRS
jgi:hypothetical protein